MRACCQYQIRDLEEGQPYWVRVSAFSGLEAGKPLGNSSASQSFGALGYGVARRTEPWSAVPAPQRPHKPTNVTFKLSTTGLVDERISPGEIPDQLDVAWRHPVLDHNTTLFDEVDGGQAIEAYVLEWDTDPYFHFGKPAGSYAARAITQGGDPLPCSLANCSFSLGAEVQVLRVYSGDGNALVAGSYALGSAGNSAEGPRTACVDFDATFGALEGELEGLLSAKVRVSREPITSPGPGFEYRITFLGAGVRGDVAPLEVLAKGPEGNCTAFRVQDGSSNRTTVLAQVHATTDIDGGYLTPGTAYFVRVSARNRVGTGPPQEATPLEFPTGEAIAPQAPPGLPLEVRVYANKDDGDSLLVKWNAVDTDNGAPVTR